MPGPTSKSTCFSSSEPKQKAATAGAEKLPVDLDDVNLVPLLKTETDKLPAREVHFRFGDFEASSR
ncbi:MAG: hypothetical protein K1X78_28310 [Verrucomicrobiaceae bacterium]|nr:hypothetical protein [Verrucomicrobiaceae bacterium]